MGEFDDEKTKETRIPQYLGVVPPRRPHEPPYRILREMRHESLREMSERLEISIDELMRYESGKQEPLDSMHLKLLSGKGNRLSPRDLIAYPLPSAKDKR